MKKGWSIRKKESGQHRRALDTKDDTKGSAGRNGKAPQIVLPNIVQEFGSKGIRVWYFLFFFFEVNLSYLFIYLFFYPSQEFDISLYFYLTHWIGHFGLNYFYCQSCVLCIYYEGFVSFWKVILQFGSFPDQFFWITINGYWLWQLWALDGVNALIHRDLYKIHNIFLSKSLEFGSHRVIIRTICIYYRNFYRRRTFKFVLCIYVYVCETERQKETKTCICTF